MPKHVEAGTNHLRLAAYRIRVLYPIAGYVRRAYLAALHQLAQHTGDGNLATVPANILDALVERRITALHRVRRHRAGGQRRRQHVFTLKYGRQGQGCGYLRPIEQGQSFFRRQD